MRFCIAVPQASMICVPSALDPGTAGSERATTKRSSMPRSVFRHPSMQRQMDQVTCRPCVDVLKRPEAGDPC